MPALGSLPPTPPSLHPFTMSTEIREIAHGVLARLAALGLDCDNKLNEFIISRGIALLAAHGGAPAAPTAAAPTAAAPTAAAPTAAAPTAAAPTAAAPTAAAPAAEEAAEEEAEEEEDAAPADAYEGLTRGALKAACIARHLNNTVGFHQLKGAAYAQILRDDDAAAAARAEVN